MGDKCVLRKEWKIVCEDLKQIYKEANLEEAKAASESFVTKYQKNKILIKKYMINENHLLGLFGNEITEQTTDEELENIINATSEKEYEGHINFFGQWTTESKK